MNLHLETGQLQPIAPFDFKHSLHFLGMFAPMHDAQMLQQDGEDQGTLTKALSAHGETVVFQMHSTGRVEQPELTYTLFAEQPISVQVHAAAVDRISFFLSLQDDLRPFYALAQTDPAFAPIISQLYGYHQVKFLTPFENACWAILSQRNLMTIALKMKRALTEKFGSSVVVNGVRYEVFPDPAHLAVIDPGELLPFIRNERRVEYLTSVAQAFSTVNEGFLRSAPYAEVEAWLRRIKGIGEWSANFILLRGLGRMDKAPLSEKRSFEAASRIYGHDQPLTGETFQHLAEKYGPWQGYWAHYLRVAS